jgi:hypothetical protein
MRTMSMFQVCASAWLPCAILMFTLFLPTGRTFAEGELPTPPRPNPEKPVDYVGWLNKTFGANSPEEERTCKAIREALDKLKTDELVADELAPFTWFEGFPWEGDEKHAEFLKRNRQALDEFERALQGPIGCFPLVVREPDEYSKDLAPLQRTSALGIARILLPAEELRGEAYREWEAGNRELLPDRTFMGLRAGCLMERTPARFLHGLALSCHSAGYYTLRYMLEREEGRDELARDLAKRLLAFEEGQRELASLDRRILVQQLTGWDAYQRISPRPSPADTEALEMFDECCEALRNWVQLPYRKAMRDTATKPLERKLKELSDAVEKTGTWGMLLSFDWTESDRIERTKTETERRATHLIVHLHAHHAEHGAFPKKLDELKIPKLDTLRIDPFRGRDFVYETTKDGFKLYSVSLNSHNDGGKHDPDFEKDDYVFWPMEKD